MTQEESSYLFFSVPRGETCGIYGLSSWLERSVQRADWYCDKEPVVGMYFKLTECVHAENGEGVLTMIFLSPHIEDIAAMEPNVCQGLRRLSSTIVM